MSPIEDPKNLSVPPSSDEVGGDLFARLSARASAVPPAAGLVPKEWLEDDEDEEDDEYGPEDEVLA